MNKKAYGFVIALRRDPFFGKETLLEEDFNKPSSDISSFLSTNEVEYYKSMYKRIRDETNLSTEKLARLFYYMPRCTHSLDNIFFSCCKSLQVECLGCDNINGYARIQEVPSAYNWYEILRAVSYTLVNYMDQHGIVPWDIVEKETKKVLYAFEELSLSTKRKYYKVFKSFFKKLQENFSLTNNKVSKNYFVLTESHKPQMVVLNGINYSY